jgi:hypothetical protein
VTVERQLMVFPPTKLDGPTKVVFLDIDGVLNGRWSIQPGDVEDYTPIWPEPVRHLNRITDTTGAIIVIHSTWRWRQTLEDLRDELQEYGITGNIFDATPNKDRSRCMLSGPGPWELRFYGDDRAFELERPGSIQVWLDRHPEVTDFVILDDDDDRMAHLTDHLVNTSSSNPLGAQHADKAIQMLGGPI